MAATPKDLKKSSKTLRFATKEDSPFVPGRRSFFNYRDLGVTDASAGEMRAQVMTTIADMKQPTGWHYHECEGQFIYVLKGWLDLDFETGESVRLTAGESAFIPGGMRHNETGISEDFELLEVSIPAEMGTMVCERPSGFPPLVDNRHV